VLCGQVSQVPLVRITRADLYRSELWLPRFSVQHSSSLLLFRDKEGKDCAPVRPNRAAADSQCTLMFVDNLRAHPESETGSADSFGGEERFEDPRLGLPIHAVPCIGDRHLNSPGAGAPLRCGARSHQQSPAMVFAQHVHGIADEVIQHLPNFALVAEQSGIAETPFGPNLRVK
jgi:hypothetical protein